FSNNGGVTAAGQMWNGNSLGKASNDVVGSQGVTNRQFISIDPNSANDNCTDTPAAPFGSNRRVTGRNAPTAVGAIFNRQNFWYGSANDIFNGENPFGNTANNPSTTVAAGGGGGGGGGAGEGEAGGGGGGGGNSGPGNARTRVTLGSLASVAVGQT